MSNPYQPQYPSPDQPQQPNYSSGPMYPPPPPPPPYYQPPSAGYVPVAPPYTTATGYPPAGVPANSVNNTLAIVSLVMGILGLCTGITAIIAIICGHLALNEIKRSGGVMQGRGMAIAGLVLGYVMLAIFVFALIFDAISAANGTGVPAQ